MPPKGETPKRRKSDKKPDATDKPTATPAPTPATPAKEHKDAKEPKPAKASTLSTVITASRYLLFSLIFTLTILYAHWHAFVLAGYEGAPPPTDAFTLPFAFENPLASILDPVIPCPTNAVCGDAFNITGCSSIFHYLAYTSVQGYFKVPIPGDLEPRVRLPFPANQGQCAFNSTYYTDAKRETYGNDSIAALGRDVEVYMRKMGGLLACPKALDENDVDVKLGKAAIAWYHPDLKLRIPLAYGFTVNHVREIAKNATRRGRGGGAPQKNRPNTTDLMERFDALLITVPAYDPAATTFSKFASSNPLHSLFLERVTSKPTGTLDSLKSRFVTVASPVMPSRCGSWKSLWRWWMPIGLMFGWIFSITLVVMGARQEAARMRAREAAKARAETAAGNGVGAQ